MNDKQEQIIIEFLQQNQYASIKTLSNTVGVSQSTVRRALSRLEQRGLVKRKHGGAQICEQFNHFPSFLFRSQQNSLQKKKMALSAIKLIKNGDIVFLDGTSSAFFIAEYLQEFENVKVITNGIDTLSLLAKNNVGVYSTGGVVSATNRSVLIGSHAQQMISKFNADVCFFSALAVDENGDIYDCFEEENFIRQAMIEHSSKRVFLCDHTKFGKKAAYKLCSLNNVDLIISDQMPNFNLLGATAVVIE